MQIERCLWKRFGAAFAAVSGVLLLFYGLLLVRFALSREANTDFGSVLHIVLQQLAKSGDVLVTVAAPIAMLAVLWRLRRSGLLLSLFAAGYRPARLRRTLLGLGLAVLVAAAAAHEVASRAMMPNPHKVRAWRSEGLWGTYLTRFHPRPKTSVVMLRSDTLDAWEVTDWRWIRTGCTIRFLDAIPLHGGPMPTEGTAIPPPPTKMFHTPPPSHWLGAPPPLPVALTSLLRMLMAPILVLVGAYLVLVLPRDRLALAWPGLLLMLGVASTTTMALGVLLRQAPTWGVVATLAYLVSIVVLVVRLERRLARRGLTLSAESTERPR